jgi:hypothetical protein
MGATAEEIVQKLPSLDLPSVYEVIAYVLRNRAAVDEYLRSRNQAGVELRSEIEKSFAPEAFRARLLARRGAARGVPR